MDTSIAFKPDSSHALPPFWFDLWQSQGWSSRVARNWSQDRAYRSCDTFYLERVLPTLTPEQRGFVERILQAECASPLCC